MGIYLNPNNSNYAEMLRGKVFVDHSMLIEKTNEIIRTPDKMLCVSRPRRFGKSTDANMLVAYYSKGCDSKDIFDQLKISKSDNYLNNLNQHNVIHLNMQNFLSKTHDISKMIDRMTKLVFRELNKEFTGVDYFDTNDLVQVFEDIYFETQLCFIFIIDEWDCVFREYKDDTEAQKLYLDFLRNLLKDQPYVSLAYMTGILTIKKYGTHSALNMFEEISMIDPGPYAKFMGFTKQEVYDLCKQHDVSFEKMKSWYDGYHLTEDISTFSPRSVVMAFSRKKFGNYWTSIEGSKTYEDLKIYIDMGFDGLKDDIISLLSGESVDVWISSFQNDIISFKSKDDVLTLLIHLGYLGYNEKEKSAYIPNKEVVDSFVNSIRSSNWNQTTKALINSKKPLEATWNKDEAAVAKYV